MNRILPYRFLYTTLLNAYGLSARNDVKTTNKYGVYNKNWIL